MNQVPRHTPLRLRISRVQAVTFHILRDLLAMIGVMFLITQISGEKGDKR